MLRAAATNERKNATTSRQKPRLLTASSKGPWPLSTRELACADEVGPESVRAAGDDCAAESLAPVAIVAILGAPRPQALSCLSQSIFGREADRAVYLVRCRRREADGLVCAQFRCC